MIAMPVQWGTFQLAPGATPVYEQLADWLQERIVDGELEPGERLPSERAWAPLVGHSYDTARKATQLLKARGFLEARQGVGTVVTSPLRWTEGLRPKGGRKNP